MGLRSVLTRVKHAIFGKPLTHDEAQAQRRADLGNRGSGAERDAHARSIQNQTWGPM